MTYLNNFAAVAAALHENHGINMSAGGCPFLHVEGHPYMYAPCETGWNHQHADAKDWTWPHLVRHDDPKLIAAAIAEHFSATKKSS
jgi:hypothetical protein